MKTQLRSDFDYAEALYDEGYSNRYGETAFQPAVAEDGHLEDKDGRTLPVEEPVLYLGASHRRGVMLVKQTPPELRPFLLVFDRLLSQEENDYEVLWHLGADVVRAGATQVETEDFTLMTSSLPEKDSGLALVRGETFPEWQGWRGNSMQQGEYHPLWTAKILLHSQSLRLVTLLYPSSLSECPVAAVEASTDPMEKRVLLRLKTGKTLEFTEPPL